MGQPVLTLYYDGQCPFCSVEMRRLMRWNTARRLAFVDMSRPGFDPTPLGVDMAALNRELHGLGASGRLMLVGVDAILSAYTLVGRGWMVAPLRLRWLRPPLASLYRRFAHNRYRISHWLGCRAAPACESEACAAHFDSGRR